jgi:hypothetical protein
MGIGGKTSGHSPPPAMTIASFTDKLATLATDDLLQLIRRMITEEIFNGCFDAAVDEACRRDENLAVTIEAMWA